MGGSQSLNPSCLLFFVRMDCARFCILTTTTYLLRLFHFSFGICLILFGFSFFLKIVFLFFSLLCSSFSPWISTWLWSFTESDMSWHFSVMGVVKILNFDSENWISEFIEFPLSFLNVILDTITISINNSSLMRSSFSKLIELNIRV